MSMAGAQKMSKRIDIQTDGRHDCPSMHIETAGTAWSGLPSDDEEGPWEVRRGYFLFCKRNTM